MRFVQAHSAQLEKDTQKFGVACEARLFLSKLPCLICTTNRLIPENLDSDISAENWQERMDKLLAATKPWVSR